MKIIVATAALVALAGCSAGSGTTAARPAAAKPVATAAAEPASARRTTARGSFVGDGGHVTTGTAEIVRQDNRWLVRLGPDFSLDGAPDPKVALGSRAEGGYRSGTILGPLNGLTGEQVFALTPGLDIGDYDQVWIWCERFDVPLGHADLTLL